MSDETRTPQKDPPEGSRKVVERELRRQDERKDEPQRDTQPSGEQDRPDQQKK